MKVQINSEKIIKALEEQFTIKNQIYFESVVERPITDFIKMFFNAVTFDIFKFDEFLHSDDYSNLSSYEVIKKKYGVEFLNFFKDELTSRKFCAIAVIE